VTVVLIVVVYTGPGVLERHVEPGEDGQYVPLELKQGVVLAWAEGPECEDRVLQALVLLVELCVHEAIKLKNLHEKEVKKIVKYLTFGI